MGLFSKKVEVPKNTIRVTATDKKGGTALDVEVHDKITNFQYIHMIPNLLLNVALDFIIRYNIDINTFISDFTSDLKRAHHEYIQKQGDSTDDR